MRLLRVACAALAERLAVRARLLLRQRASVALARRHRGGGGGACALHALLTQPLALQLARRGVCGGRAIAAAPRTRSSSPRSSRLRQVGGGRA
jgi:hypothetical protein